MLIIWLQGIWLPLHGVSCADTPLHAGIDTMPLMPRFVVCGPLGGLLCDRYGSRTLATGGILVTGLAAGLLMTRPRASTSVCSPPTLHSWAPAWVSSVRRTPHRSRGPVPAERRGAAAGMRSMVLHAGMTAAWSPDSTAHTEDDLLISPGARRGEVVLGGRVLDVERDE
jgi:hypothetical protein